MARPTQPLEARITEVCNLLRRADILLEQIRFDAYDYYEIKLKEPKKSTSQKQKKGA